MAAEIDLAEGTDLEYIDVEYETTLNEGIFDRFLGSQITTNIDGKLQVQTGFPMPVDKPIRPLQRLQILPKQILGGEKGGNFEPLDLDFQNKILKSRGVPVMNGSYMVVFIYEETIGQFLLNLNSLTNGEGAVTFKLSIFTEQ